MKLSENVAPVSISIVAVMFPTCSEFVFDSGTVWFALADT